MRKAFKISLAAFTFLLLAAAASAQQTQLPPPPQQGPPPRTVIPVRLVHLVAAVTDRRDQFVTDLTKSDFSVSEDGKKQDITYFARQADLPLRIGVLLDTSNSIRERLHFEQDAAIDFLYNVVRRNRDQAFVMTFDNEPEVVQDYTDDVGELSEVIQKQNAGGGTALNDAIFAASQKLVSAPLAPGPDPDIRRVLIVISDGDDNLSDHPLSDAIQMADRAGVSIYAISSNNDWTTTDGTSAVKAIKSEGDKILKEYADETGGRVFYPYHVDDLAQSFLDIGTELRSQYLIGYAPPYPTLDGKFHTVDLRVDRKGLTVRSRKGYFAIAPVASIPGQQGAGASPQK